MKKITLLTKLPKSLCLLLAALLVSFSAMAKHVLGESATVDGIKYKYWLDDWTAEVWGVVDKSITSLVIPATITVGSKSCSVTQINPHAFSGCSSLVSAEIPNSVASIGYGTFLNCNSLESFSGKFASDDHRCLIVDGTLKAFAPANLTEYSIPNSVTEIERETFWCCSSLKSVVIPNSVSVIGVYAFSRCSSLASVKVDNPNPANIRLGGGVFSRVHTSGCTLYVPEGSVELYKSAEQWKEFGTIEEFGTQGIDDAQTSFALRVTGDGFVAVGTRAGERVEVYDFSGRLIYVGVTTEGETLIPASEKQCIVRIGSKTMKHTR